MQGGARACEHEVEATRDQTVPNRARRLADPPHSKTRLSPLKGGPKTLKGGPKTLKGGRKKGKSSVLFGDEGLLCDWRSYVGGVLLAWWQFHGAECAILVWDQ
ncbi:MAG: hypothetical protein BMS9Abin17_1522 [Acidimicrobiia bacterium]|nr:MAG: hypothetical protein BMS9Abin17_1522 [Acidimicrobiia bacterium]